MDAFQRLGLQPGCTVHDVRKAYKDWARKTHPDRVPEAQRAEALNAFLEIRHAYEEAMDHLEKHGEYTADSERKAAPKVHVMKEMFTNVCSELDREGEDKLQAEAQAAKESLLDAWPNQTKCRPIVSPLFCLFRLKEKLKDHTDILDFVCRFEQKRLQSYAQQNQVANEARATAQQALAQSRAQHIRTNWQRRRFSLQKYTLGWTTNDFSEVLHLLSDNVAIYTPLHRLYRQKANVEAAANRHQQEMQAKSHELRLRKTADQIKDAFPNRRILKTILSNLLPWDRTAILSYLPEEIQEIAVQIFGLLMSSAPSTASAASRTSKRKRP